MAKIPAKIKKPLNDFLEEISSICTLNRVILYGSYAYGNPKANSDIDLAIFSKSANEHNRLNLMTKILSRIAKYKLDFQPLVFSYKDYISKDNDFIREEIISRGKILK